MWHDGFGPAMGYGFGPGLLFFGFFKFLGFLLLLALIFFAIRMFTRGARYAGFGPGPWMGGRGRGRGPGNWGNWFGRDDAMETARERLARSEITPEQFEAIRSGLEPKREQRDWDQRWDAGRGWRRDDALELARMRFARGEISSEEFEMIRKALDG